VIDNFAGTILGLILFHLVRPDLPPILVPHVKL
jgi:hypothetical protein